MGEIADEEASRASLRVPQGSLPTYLTPSGQPIAPWRQSLDLAAARAVDWSADFLASHWLFLANVAVGIYAFLPFIAPALLALGLTGPADAIYYIYSYLCHQRPDRSWYLFGEKMAYCQRDAVIYPVMFLAGIAYSFRRSIRPLSLLWFLVLIAPVAVDGTTQALMLRESTPELRAITGALFGAAVVWLCYPLVQRAMD
jgi:uncharacterized membrane protein